MQYFNGDEYDGWWLKGKYFGYGELKQKNGYTYSGKWENN